MNTPIIRTCNWDRRTGKTKALLKDVAVSLSQDETDLVLIVVPNLQQAAFMNQQVDKVFGPHHPQIEVLSFHSNSQLRGIRQFPQHIYFDEVNEIVPNVFDEILREFAAFCKTITSYTTTPPELTNEQVLQSYFRGSNVQRNFRRNSAEIA